ncbi:helix-turn-helix domain-containing protein [Paenibacillus senegalensis]|uniref:helix-turn-helix domain-containing protein n=1 Tax=Paenibacillus senegalensis TaxID=1465766 RepID=UPI0021CC16BC|nr:helix-turn-helix transcriptional regulator [Paenibacillus senegalensis]
MRELRKSRNMTQEQLAELTDTAISYIGTIERGEQNITIQTLDKIAQALQSDIYELLTLSQTDNETIRKINALLLTQDHFHQEKSFNVLREMLRKPNDPPH